MLLTIYSMYGSTGVPVFGLQPRNPCVFPKCIIYWFIQFLFISKGDISSNNLFLPLHSSCLSFFFFLFLFCWISYWWNQIKMNWQALLCNVNLKNLLLQEKPLWCFCHLILTVCRYWDFLSPLNCNFSPKWYVEYNFWLSFPAQVTSQLC